MYDQSLILESPSSDLHVRSKSNSGITFIRHTCTIKVDFDRTCTSDEGDSRIQTLMVHVRLMKVIPELHFESPSSYLNVPSKSNSGITFIRPTYTIKV
jgi:hypothetical protein